MAYQWIIRGIWAVFLGGAIVGVQVGQAKDKQVQQEQITMTDVADTKDPVVTFTLENGFTILVRPVHTVPKVSMQLWYGVGSRDETDRERGIAHLIEHMIFKGTKTLSETDIDTITHTLSGYCNAFTGHDFTGYLFNVPSHNWKKLIPVMADCMENCTFDTDKLNFEMKAVIQELKMFRDENMQSLVEEMVSTIFSQHPYHHPIIGYKEDLWSVGSEDLLAFYKKHYIPNNAALIVVGDVDPQEVLKEVSEHFGPLKSDPTYKHVEHSVARDIASKSVRLYRDVKQPIAIYAFTTPGLKDKSSRMLDLLEWLLGHGASSRLYRRLVDELQLVTSLQTISYDLFDQGIFFIVCQPKDLADNDKIVQVIREELAQLADGSISDEELERACKQMERDRCNMLEDNEDQARDIGRYFFGLGDPNYAFTRGETSPAVLRKEVAAFVGEYFRPVLMHTGTLEPLPDSEKELWKELQEASDDEDKRILEARRRDTEIEPPSYAKQVQPGEFNEFSFPKAEQLQLKNGIKVFSYNNDTTPKIDIVLDLKANNYYDPDDKEGIMLFVSKMLTEGTKRYPGARFLEEIEARGMVFGAYTGGVSISLLEDDLPFALDMLKDVLTEAAFDTREIEKVRTQILAGIKNFWDEPKAFGKQLIREKIYRGHPYSKNKLGSAESISSFTRDDLLKQYKRLVTPDGARIAIVGKLDKYDLKQLLEEKLGSWQGEPLADLQFPELKTFEPAIVQHQINRDQFFLAFAAPSIRRTDESYDKILLFDQSFGGGVLGSMNSRLFRLRQQTGLFYVIQGSLLSGADEEPGMMFVVSLVSGDRLLEAEKAIKGAIDDAADTITTDDIKESYRAILSASIDRFALNHSIGESFLFLDKFKLPVDYFDVRAQKLAKISLDEVKKAAEPFLHSDKLMTMRIGRVDTLKEGKESSE